MESHVSNPNLPPVPGAAKPEVSAVKRHFLALKEYMNASIIGQEDLIERLLISLLADGHLLVEGAPGLAKTKALKRLSEALKVKVKESSLHRTYFLRILPAVIFIIRKPVSFLSNPDRFSTILF